MRPLPQLLQQPPSVEVMTLTHAAILETRTVEWPDEAACAAQARSLAARSALRDATVELHGALGAGKTTFVRHLLRALGVGGRIKSPSYAVVEMHTVPARDTQAATNAAHFDFYRFADAREWEDAGLRDLYAAPGIKLAEWPEKARALLPAPDLRLVIEPTADDARRVVVQALTPLGVELLA